MSKGPLFHYVRRDPSYLLSLQIKCDRQVLLLAVFGHVLHVVLVIHTESRLSGLTTKEEDKESTRARGRQLRPSVVSVFVSWLNIVQ